MPRSTNGVHIFIIATVAFFLRGCATVNFADRGIDGCSPSTYMDEGPPPPALMPEEVERQHIISDSFSQFAIFSSNAYEYTAEKSCLENPIQKFKCPSGWKLLGGPVNDPSGLYFETLWHEGDNTNKPTLVFAFRGTEFSRFSDWVSNLRWFLRWFPHDDQYDIARTKVQSVLESKWGKQYCNHVNIYATGHSLGGGIAQHIAYAFPCITAYVFDPSPVTGYYQLNPPFDATVIRIYEKGEILGYVRALLKFTYPVTDNITEVPEGTSFSQSPLKEHSMAALAAGILKHAKDGELRDIYYDYLRRTSEKKATECKKS
jgi:lipase (class 3)